MGQIGKETQRQIKTDKIAFAALQIFKLPSPNNVQITAMFDTFC